MSVELQALCLECGSVVCDFDSQPDGINFYPRPCAHAEHVDGLVAAQIWNAWQRCNEDQVAVVRERFNVRLVAPNKVETCLKIDPSDDPLTLSAPGSGNPGCISSEFRDKWRSFGENAAEHRDKAPQRIEEGRCVSPAVGIRWLMYDGSLEPVRCGASNRCTYCAMFAALESALLLRLDAQIRQPEVGLTTTTRRPDFPIDALRKAEKRLWEALRKGKRIGRVGRRPKGEPDYEAFPDLQYVGFLEWTTGDGTRSGGYRRPHIHHLVKGIPADHPLLAEIWIDGPHGDQVKTTKLEQRVSELWNLITGDAYVVEVRPLRTPAGAIAYLALHHHKRSQAPPPGFRGRRLRPSKGYYEIPVKELRQLARKLASQERVRMAVKKAIEIELEGAEAPDQYEADEQLLKALCEGLRSLAENPLELQLDLLGDPGLKAERLELERQELLRRMTSELEKIRSASPPELVQVREREIVDRETGIVHRRVAAILGPLEPRIKRQLLIARDRDFAEAVAA